MPQELPLQAWVGNKVTIERKWNKILEKQENIMEVWEKSKPTYRGKELILKALVMSRAWFLATVNGMPRHIEGKMRKRMKDFLWNGQQRALMEYKMTSAPREEGVRHTQHKSKARSDTDNVAEKLPHKRRRKAHMGMGSRQAHIQRHKSQRSAKSGQGIKDKLGEANMED